MIVVVEGYDHDADEIVDDDVDVDDDNYYYY